MINKILFCGFILLLSYSVSFSQNVSYEQIKNEFKNFEYEKVIKLSEEVINSGELTDSLLIDTYLMRAVSYYSLANDRSTRQDFQQILRIKKDFLPNPLEISPKLITLFNEVKTEFLASEQPDSKEENLQQGNIPSKIFDDALMRNSILRNIALPGWGQLNAGFTTKGIVLGTASLLNLTGMIYFIADASKKQNAYLSETNNTLIQEKYDAYNKSYKIRNALIISYAAIWIYSQIDILFFNNQNNFLKELQNTNSISYEEDKNQFHLNFRFPF